MSIGLGAIAQNTNQVTTMSGSGDTIKGSSLEYALSAVTTGAKSISIQAKITKGSATTTVAHKFILQVSNDGLNFNDLGTDTLTCTNIATNTKLWVIEGNPYKYYRIAPLARYTTGIAATDTIIITGYILPNEISGFAQNVTNALNSTGGTTATITNTATAYVGVQVKQWYSTVSIQALVHKTSGTVAGTVTLQGSNDGTNFVTVNTGYITNDITTAPFTTGGGATLTATNVTDKSKIFVVRGSPYEYYRLSYTGSGTMVATLKGFVVGSK